MRLGSLKRSPTLVMLGALALGSVSLAACRKSETTEQKAETKTAEPSEDKKAARPKPAPVDEGIDVPTEEDFEEAAEKEITAESNLQKELDQIEKQMQAQKP